MNNMELENVMKFEAEIVEAGRGWNRELIEKESTAGENFKGCVEEHRVYNYEIRYRLCGMEKNTIESEGNSYVFPNEIVFDARKAVMQETGKNIISQEMDESFKSMVREKLTVALLYDPKIEDGGNGFGTLKVLAFFPGWKINKEFFWVQEPFFITVRRG